MKKTILFLLLIFLLTTGASCNNKDIEVAKEKPLEIQMPCPVDISLKTKQEVLDWIEVDMSCDRGNPKLSSLFKFCIRNFNVKDNNTGWNITCGTEKGYMEVNIDNNGKNSGMPMLIEDW